VKIDADLAGSRGNGLRCSEHAGRADVAMTSMSRRALSYSIDNLLATTSAEQRHRSRRDADCCRPSAGAAVASLRLHAISQQRTIHYTYDEVKLLRQLSLASLRGRLIEYQLRLG